MSRRKNNHCRIPASFQIAEALALRAPSKARSITRQSFTFGVALFPGSNISFMPALRTIGLAPLPYAPIIPGPLNIMDGMPLTLNVSPRLNKIRL